MQLFKIIADKTNNQIDIEIDGNYSPASLSYGLRDMFLFLALNVDENEFNLKSNGHFIIEASQTEIEPETISLSEISYKDLKKLLEILKRGAEMFPNLVGEEISDDLTRDMVYRIPKILSVMTADNKQAVVNHIKDDLDFYINKALPAIQPGSKINFHHSGFSFDEIKQVVQNVYLRITNRYPLMFRFDFIRLKMK